MTLRTDHLPDAIAAVVQRHYAESQGAPLYNEAQRLETLPGLSLHGLRKARGRRMVEAGGAARAVMAVLGHGSLAEAERCTKTCARKASATAALTRIAARGFATQTWSSVEDALMQPATAEAADPPDAAT